MGAQQAVVDNAFLEERSGREYEHPDYSSTWREESKATGTLIAIWPDGAITLFCSDSSDKCCKHTQANTCISNHNDSLEI